MQETQIIVLAIFALPIIIMSWILWRVSVELGSFDVFRHKLSVNCAPIEIRAGKPLAYARTRSPR
jgi:hypothetical protein